MVCAVRLRTHNQWSRIDCPSPHFLAWGIFDRGRTPHTHTRTHTHTHTHTPHPQTQLIRTQLTHTYSSTPNLLHTNPSPSLFSFLLTPCRLCLSFVACWKKLTCGVIRSFNLRQTLKSGYYILHDEDKILKDRATARNRIKWLQNSTKEENNDFLGV